MVAASGKAYSGTAAPLLWDVADFRTSSHPADRIVEQMVAAAVSGGAKPRRVYGTLGKLPRMPGLVRGDSRPMLLPLMGPKWWLLEAALRQGFTVIPYCWDVWTPDAQMWAERLADPRVLGVVTSASDSASLLAHLLDKPVHHVCEALAPRRFAGDALAWSDRHIDVLELGRRDEDWHKAVAPSLEVGAVHLFETERGQIIFPDPAALDAALTETRVSICFTRRRTHPQAAGTVDAMTHRYLESMAAGCVLLGDNPQDLVALVGHEPALVVDEADPAGQLQRILATPSEHDALRFINRRRVREVGTWTTRLAELDAAISDIVAIATP